MQRDTTFDIMKGIGIILMLIGHVDGIGFLHQIIYSFHMPMFFYCSGIFYEEQYNPQRGGYSRIIKTIWHYFRRLVLPLIITYCVLIIYLIPWAVVKHDPARLMQAFLRTIWLCGYPLQTQWGEVYTDIAWFVMALFVAKTILFLVSRYPKIVLPISFVLSIAAVIIYPHYKYYIPWCILNGMAALPFLAVGWWEKNYGIPCWLKIIAMIAWPFAIAFTTIEMWGCQMDIYPLSFLGACGGTLCLYYFSKWIANHTTLTAQALAQFGLCSLAILLMHELISWTDIVNTLCIHTPLVVLKSHYYLYTLFRYSIIVAVGFAAAKLPYIKKIYG